MDIESNEWEERYSKKHDRKYWKNKNTGESSWKDPNKINSKKKRSDNTKESNNNGDKIDITDVVVNNVESNADEDHTNIASKEEKNDNTIIDVEKDQKEERLEGENVWVEKYSKKHDKKYWKNEVNGETSWKDPYKDQSKKERKEKKIKSTTEIPIDQKKQDNSKQIEQAKKHTNPNDLHFLHDNSMIGSKKHKSDN